MMNFCEKVSGSENGVKVCTDCKTSKTPLWRGGPDGPKSLCNACGIRHRKQRRALLGLNNKGVGKTIENKIKKKERTTNGVSRKLKLFPVGKKVSLKRSSGLEKQSNLGEEEEEEQAAILLMALSCGLCFGIHRS